MLKIGDKVRHKTCDPDEIGIVDEIAGYDNRYVIRWLDGGFKSTDHIDVLEPVRQKRIYIAGQMSGIPHFNFPAFHAAAAKLRDEGHEVFNPAEADIARIGVDPSLDNPTGDVALAAKRHGLSRRECLAEDLSWIALNADAIALLPGWVLSSGARAEYALAEALGLEVIRL